MYKSGKYSFRVIEESDIEWARNLHNSPDVLFMLTDATFVNEMQQKKWYEKLLSSYTSQRLVIEHEDNSVGIVRLDDIDLINKSICIGLDIDKNYRRKGHGYRSFELLIRYCFDELNMNRVWLFVASFNFKALGLYNKLGFIEEGRQRERLFRDGKYSDYIMMSILRSEYHSNE